jgi:GT2 family glycosyltransferase
VGDRAAPVRLSVVVPTLGRPRLLRELLDRLGRQDAGGFEVVVAADAAEPDPAAVQAAVADRPYPARAVSAEAPGVSAARNAGWRAAAGELILFLGDDMLPADGRLIAAHLAGHERTPGAEVAVLGRVDWPRRPRPGALARWLDRGIQFDFRGLRDGEDAGWGRFWAANLSLARELLERSGGFDESYRFGYEELELAARLRPEGLRVLHAADARVQHHHPPTLEAWRVRMAEVAVAERRIVAAHPEVAPHFHDLLAPAAAIPPGRGWSARLAAVVPERAPWLGPRVWKRADLWFRQQLAPAFMAAWDQAGARADSAT